ncbi:MAG: hypothetical protein CMJ78_22035, partial [Planctomycetaceae bacterium]|nr:hypothetical protein [Planctomycetaceae bacterium]
GRFWLCGITKSSNHTSINFIRFGQHFDGQGKVTYTCRLGDGHVQASIMESIAESSIAVV